MNDQVQAPAPAPEQAAAPQPMPPMTPQQATAIKTAVLDNYSRLFNEFMTRVNNYPAMQHLKAVSFQYFEAATALMEKAIANMPLAIQAPQPQAPAEPAQAQEKAAAPETHQDAVIPDSAP